MSKTSLWQPPTKWGEDQNPIRPLPSVRIRGVGDDPASAEAAFAKHSANIRQFHMAQAHAYSLSPNNVHRGYREWPGAKATYTNINGQEYIEVELTTHRGESQPEGETKHPWDWALIEYHVDITLPAGVTATHAFLEALRVVPKSTEAGITNDGYVLDSATTPGCVDGLSPPVIQFPDDMVVDSSLIETGNVQVCSLAVDLRRFNGAPVNIDILGYINSVHQVPQQYRAAEMPVTSTGTPVFLGHTEVGLDSGTIYSSSVPSMLWPYEGSSMQPGTTQTDIDNFLGPVTVPASSAPAAPYTLGSSPYLNYEGQSTHPASYSVDTYQGTHFADIVYDPISGIPVSCTVYSMDPYNQHGVPNTDKWDQDWRMLTAFYSREIITDYTSAPVAASCYGDIKFAAGFGAVPWKVLQVANDVTGYSRFYMDDNGAVKLIPTTTIAKNVAINGPPPYALMGQVDIFPMQYAVNFVKA